MTCGSCGGGGGSGVCTCYAEDSAGVEVTGIGSVSAPFQFNATQYPTPRPLGFIQRTTGITNIPAPDLEVPFTVNDIGIAGGMADISTHPTYLEAPVDGVYLFGSYLSFDDYTPDTFLMRLRVDVVPIGSSFSSSSMRIIVASNTTDRYFSLVDLYPLTAGSRISVNVTSDGTLDIIGTSENRPTLWALWVGEF